MCEIPLYNVGILVKFLKNNFIMDTILYKINFLNLSYILVIHQGKNIAIFARVKMWEKKGLSTWYTAFAFQ